ncbi:STAS/SEC14 domain-containing protein [Flammeovirgaceae bacterium SG7u.111]|nr:STAS/SEC14 domain-containing protein [Flammeovirgaceae bacterium SG7u.132]WPO38043.1 STAS/SEC14 domain-containing protein [Flammeovirgaceae bacterium SG7u.111]
MNTLYENKFVKIGLCPSSKTIEFVFLPATEMLSDQLFRETMNRFAELANQHRPNKELVDLRHMVYTIRPEMQQWLDEYIFPRYTDIIRKIAFVVSPDIFVMASIEQTMEEDRASEFVIKYFREHEQAKDWLMAS